MVMHRHYRHLAFTGKYQIMFLSRWGKSIPLIARESGWHKSTVSR